MSGANHIAGGIVFTGIYLSMSDINIFSQPHFLFFTAFFAVLPDVDHIKSFIGKIFYPLAKYLNRKFGHRTLTHSLLFYLVLGLLIGAIEQILNRTSYIANIYWWAYGSHLIFDMLTKQGIPLFYPFKKNPCVIPANPQFRLKSSDFRTEAMIFLVFFMLGFTCKSLYAHGFWNTYNKTFDNISHIYQETKLFNGVINLQYNFDNKNGNAYIITATDNSLLLFNKEFITVDNSNRIIKLKPIRTNKTLQFYELNFSNISFDSLQSLLKNKAIKSLKIQSALPINFIKDNQPQSSSAFSLENIYNPVLKSYDVDSIDEQTQNEISLTQIQLQNNQQEQDFYLQKKQELFNQLQTTEDNLNSADLATKEDAIKNYQSAKNNYQNLSQPLNQSQALLIRLNLLKSKIHIKKSQSINGYLNYFIIK